MTEAMPPAPPGAAELLASARGLVLHYPWVGLEDLLDVAGQASVELVGYGSLLEPSSARRTVPHTPDDGHDPVLAWGAYRIFNRAMSGEGANRYGVVSGSAERAALNVAWTGSVAHGFNARLLPVRVEDVAALRAREVAYDLVPVVWRPWAQPDAEPAVAFALSAADRPHEGVVPTRADVLPCPGYLEVCRRGARRVSAEFEALFVATTVLADGHRPLHAVLGDGDGGGGDGLGGGFGGGGGFSDGGDSAGGGFSDGDGAGAGPG